MVYLLVERYNFLIHVVLMLRISLILRSKYYKYNGRKVCMNDNQIVKYIDEGANFYVRLFGTAEHMEIVDTGFYSYVKPKDGEQGITFIFDVRIENLPNEMQKEKISEMKTLSMPIWLGLLATDELHYLVYGKNKTHGQTVFTENDEVYMAMMPNEKPQYNPSQNKIISVKSAEEFELWAKLTNDLMHGGYPDIHPKYHYQLCQKGLMNCYILYKGNIPAAVAAVMNNNGISSLEFVATIPEMRKQGLASEICLEAICNTFSLDAKIITLRAINLAAAKLYQSLGFKAYNYLL